MRFGSLPASSPPAQLSAPSAANLTSKARTSPGLRLGHSFDIGIVVQVSCTPASQRWITLGRAKLLDVAPGRLRSLTLLGLN